MLTSLGITAPMFLLIAAGFASVRSGLLLAAYALGSVLLWLTGAG